MRTELPSQPTYRFYENAAIKVCCNYLIYERKGHRSPEAELGWERPLALGERDKTPQNVPIPVALALRFH